MRKTVFNKVISIIVVIATILGSGTFFGGNLGLNLGNKVYAESTDITVSQGLKFTGNGNDRQLVRLSNDWLVALLNDMYNSKLIFSVSKDDGCNWTELTSVSNMNSVQTALASNGTKVYCLVIYGGSYTYNSLIKFDATNIAESFSTSNIDTNQSSFGTGCSIAVDASGTLHAVWTSKNSGYNSNNIRYSKSINGGTTWSSASFITTDNNTSIENLHPSVVIKSDENPIIVWSYKQSTNSYIIRSRPCINGAWVATVDIFNGGLCEQGRPSVIIENNIIHVVWHGAESAGSPYLNIKYSKSSDGGTSWTTNSPYSNNCITYSPNLCQRNPSITADRQGKLYVLFVGMTGGVCNKIRMITYDGTSWRTGNVKDMTNNTSAEVNRPSTCENFRNFSSPLFIYEDNQSDCVKFQGDLNPPVEQMTVTQSVYADAEADTGRKLVRLSNGWFVCGTKNTSTSVINYYVSKDNGLTWNDLCYTEGRQAGCFAITSYGTNVYTLSLGYTSTGSPRPQLYKFDASTVTNNNALNSTCNLDSGQTEYNSMGCFITNDQAGQLYAVWATRNSTYSNSMNIRYSKTTVSDTAWSQPISITSDNLADDDNVNPSIVIRNNNPIIIYNDHKESSYRIMAEVFNGLSWNSRVIAESSVYDQSNPTAVVDRNGNIHVAWKGMDSTDNSYYNIRYSKSEDGGNSWSTPIKITNGNQYGNTRPSICADINNKIYIVWQGNDESNIWQVKQIVYNGKSWGAIYNITNNTTANAHRPSVCENYRNFSEPLVVYRDEQLPGVRFQGMINTTSALNRVMVDYFKEYDLCSNDNAGRKIVRLPNGKLVLAATYNNSNEKGLCFFYSTDNGIKWNRLGCKLFSNTVTSFSIASYGTKVFCYSCTGNNGAFFSINAAANSVADSSDYVELDPGQIGVGNTSMDIDSTGAIHVAWSAKSNNSYSYNIRYIKGNINTDGGISWATPQAITSYNLAGQDAKSPCIVTTSNNYPVIIYSYNNGTAAYVIKSSKWNGSSFVNADVCNGTVYVQSNPCAVVDSLNNIHLAWQGKDSTDSTSYNIRYSKYDGTAWSTPIKLTNGIYDQKNPSISVTTNNKVYVLWEGIDRNLSKTVNNIRRISYSGTWSSISTVTSNTKTDGEASGLSACSNYKSFVEPLFIYRDKQASTIRFSGKLYYAPMFYVLKPYTDQMFGDGTVSLSPEIVVSSPDGNPLTCRYYLEDSNTPSVTMAVYDTDLPRKVSFGAVNLSGLNDGNHYITLEVRDEFTSIQERTRFRIDKTPPDLIAMSFSSTETSVTASCYSTESYTALAVNPYKYVIGNAEGPWTSAKSYTKGSLKPNRLYSIKFYAKDKKGNIIINSSNSIYTKAQVPTLSLYNSTTTTLCAKISDGNPNSTEYQINVGTSQYVKADGTLTATPTWIVLTGKKIRITGLTSNTQYSISVKARNGNMVETGSSQTVQMRTL